jgi:hypothetical protein
LPDWSGIDLKATFCILTVMRARKCPIEIRIDSVVIAVVIMVVLIPIAIGMPAMLVFVPPSMIGVPAAFARFVQLVAPTFSLLTLIAVMLDRFVKLVIGPGDASLAVIIGEQVRSACKHEKADQCRCSKCSSSEERIV